MGGPVKFRPFWRRRGVDVEDVARAALFAAALRALPCRKCAELAPLLHDLGELGALERVLEAHERGRAIPCAKCGPGIVCGRCRTRAALLEARLELLDRICAYARARRDHAPAAALDKRPRGARDDAR